jgi:hypothetical protein
MDYSIWSQLVQFCCITGAIFYVMAAPDVTKRKGAVLFAGARRCCVSGLLLRVFFAILPP